MKYLVAVSGGVDSVVLLDVLKKQGTHELVVAHFDHGIRPDSAADARFVEALAATYKIPYVGRREELGSEASEEYARDRRYAFLRAEAKKHEATLVTAHHADDLVETVVLNLSRGTGWRGLAVLDSPDIRRPLLSFSKKQIYQYALKKRLEWVEDSTNSSDAYTRNRVRRRIAREIPSETKQKTLELWEQQVALKDEIEAEAMGVLVAQGVQYSRYFFTYVDPLVAIELLRLLVIDATGRSLPRPQLYRALLAVKTARPNTLFPLGPVWMILGGKTFSIPVKTP